MEQDMNRQNLSTSNFKENIKFGLKLLLMFGIVLIILFQFIPTYTGSYCASLIDKVNRLESIDEAKIVLIGDSNVAYGIDSELIEQSLHMPVVNMGLHGGLGNVFHEQMAKLNVHEGDIYVVCHSNYYDSGKIDNNALAWLTIENHPQLWRILRPQDIWPLVNDFPIYLKKCIQREWDGIRNQEEGRNEFNKYGDRCDERKETQPGLFDGSTVYAVPYVGDDTMNRLNELSKYMEKRGATLVIAGFPIAEGEFTAQSPTVQELQEALEQRAELPVISDFEDYKFEYKYFYNSSLHLTDEGTRMRTEQLIKDLQNYFNDEGN